MSKNSFLRTGVIVGHPGESEEDFEELCAFLEEFKFDRISAFAYSKKRIPSLLKWSKYQPRSSQKD